LARDSAQALARARDGGAHRAPREPSASDASRSDARDACRADASDASRSVASDARRSDAIDRSPGDPMGAELQAGTRRDERANLRGESGAPARKLDPRKGT
jgi:hypothetical protein